MSTMLPAAFVRLGVQGRTEAVRLRATCITRRPHSLTSLFECGVVDNYRTIEIGRLDSRILSPHKRRPTHTNTLRTAHGVHFSGR